MLICSLKNKNWIKEMRDIVEIDTCKTQSNYFSVSTSEYNLMLGIKLLNGD
jgi:hypothetical protein